MRAPWRRQRHALVDMKDERVPQERGQPSAPWTMRGKGGQPRLRTEAVGVGGRVKYHNDPAIKEAARRARADFAFAGDDLGRQRSSEFGRFARLVGRTINPAGMNGNDAFLEDSLAPDSNSALTGLASIGAGAILGLHNEAAVSTTGSLVNDGTGLPRRLFYRWIVVIFDPPANMAHVRKCAHDSAVCARICTNSG
jgi:hypothetical protein